MLVLIQPLYQYLFGNGVECHPYKNCLSTYFIILFKLTFSFSTSIIKFPIFESFIYKTHNLSDNLVQFSYSFKFYFIEIFAGYTCIYLAIVSAWTDISYLFCSYSIGEIGHGFKIYDYFCSYIKLLFSYNRAQTLWP